MWKQNNDESTKKNNDARWLKLNWRQYCNSIVFYHCFLIRSKKNMIFARRPTNKGLHCLTIAQKCSRLFCTATIGIGARAFQEKNFYRQRDRLDRAAVRRFVGHFVESLRKNVARIARFVGRRGKDHVSPGLANGRALSLNSCELQQLATILPTNKQLLLQIQDRLKYWSFHSCLGGNLRMAVRLLKHCISRQMFSSSWPTFFVSIPTTSTAIKLRWIS